MPHYEYECPVCKKTVERRCSMSDSDQQRCSGDGVADCGDPTAAAASAAAAADKLLPRLQLLISGRQGRLSHNWGNWQ